MDRRSMEEYWDKLKKEDEEFFNKSKSDEKTKNKTIDLLNTILQLVLEMEDTRIPPVLFREIKTTLDIMLKYEKEEL